MTHPVPGGTALPGTRFPHPAHEVTRSGPGHLDRARR